MCSLTTRRTSAGSSFTTWRSTTVWPASISSSAIARPLVSVSIVRVSLIVNTKHATLDSACERCSWTDMGKRYYKRPQTTEARRGTEARSKAFLGGLGGDEEG